MTRQELLPLKDQVVHYDGWVESWNIWPDGTRDILLKSVKVRPYSLELTEIELNEQPPVCTDHLWLRVHEGFHCPPLKRLVPWFGFGKVGWYQRANKTVDLGVTSVKSVPGGDVAKEAKRSISSGRWAKELQSIQSLIDRIKTQDLVVFDPYTSATAIASDLETLYVPLLKKNQEAVAAAPKNGRSKAPKRFADLLRP